MEHEGRHELPEAANVAPSRRPRLLFPILAGLLIVLLGVAIAAQVRDTGSGDALDSARPAEAALRQEITALESTLTGLEQNGSEAALDEARARLSDLSIQVGTVPAAGPGVVLTVTDPVRGVGSEVVLDMVQELRAAGAEAIQIAGADAAPLRIGVDSWVTGPGGSVVVDDVPLVAPYTVTAIGDGPTLAAALNIPGGVVDTVARTGGALTIAQSSQVTVSALRQIEARQYSQPGN